MSLAQCLARSRVIKNCDTGGNKKLLETAKHKCNI